MVCLRNVCINTCIKEIMMMMVIIIIIIIIIIICG